MSDFERNLATSPFGSTARTGTVAIDHGLREHMLRIYNYMALGVAITGLAALGIYMLSVTADPAAAFKIIRSGGEAIPAALNKTNFVTPIGYYVFVSPLKWVIMLSPLVMVLAISFGIDRL